MASLQSLGQFFSTIGDTVAKDYAAINAPRPTPIYSSNQQPQQSGVLGFTGLNPTTIIVLLLVAVAAIFGFRAISK